jgi:hypothetical protein
MLHVAYKLLPRNLWNEIFPGMCRLLPNYSCHNISYHTVQRMLDISRRQNN